MIFWVKLLRYWAQLLLNSGRLPKQFALNFKEHQKNNCGSDVVQFEFEIDRKDGFETSFSIQSDDLPNGVGVVFSKLFGWRY